ncbi:MAG: hypothetical protein PHY12_09250 [Eubacteriales bacterium]|nr:hypothetical protein [Eubacteriales bacterium]
MAGAGILRLARRNLRHCGGEHGAAGKRPGRLTNANHAKAARRAFPRAASFYLLLIRWVRNPKPDGRTTGR